MRKRIPNNSTAWRNACHRAARYANKHSGQLSHAESYLTKHGWEHFGVEYVDVPEADRHLSYLNTGETYVVTVCRENGRCFVASWGDWYEEVEREYCQNNDVIRCGYCSAFTPASEPSDQTICEHCGNHVC